MASKSKNLLRKKNLVLEIKTLFKNSPTVVIVRFNKIDANAMNALRGDLEQVNGFLKIFKNTLVSLAIKDEYPTVSKNLVLNNAIVFSKDDGLSCLRILRKFGEEHKGFTIVKGVFNYSESSGEELNQLASLPDKNGLLAMMLNALNAKLKTFLYGLKEIASKLENKE